ncbi:flavodoxin family protein [Metallumcola ferriviriculae]|uniref:Flavodoxin family protein n=1 Tax=Metallumcola ferriviriculae TaxID=3039180 RepID=A0AAU0UNS8_9FIRM|nr:flavodoxin family protein [Desulfitibacteraceae bacterium MK1]
MKIVAINGSHRKGKNTAKMLETVLEEASSLGAEVELMELCDYDIKHCLSCNKCLRRPECSIKDDDMAPLGEKLLAADGIILGSPVYWHNVTTLMKNFMDRTRYMHMTANLLGGKAGAAVTHAGLRNGGQEACLAIMENFMKSQGLLVVDDRNADGGILSAGATGTMLADYQDGKVSFRKSVEEDEIAISACRQIGRNMVHLLKRLD